MRKILITAIAFLVLAPAAQAMPTKRAQTIAVHHWHKNPCGGKVKVTKGDYDASNNAQSWWDNPRSSDLWHFPSLNTNCEIDFNRNASWDWPKFCTVMVHEYGHLLGHQHSDKPDDVMNPIYTKPIKECVS